MKKIKCTLGVITLVASISLAGCSLDKKKTPKTQITKVEETKKTKTFFRAGDIKVVSAFNPTNQKQEYYFMTVTENETSDIMPSCEIDFLDGIDVPDKKIDQNKICSYTRQFTTYDSIFENGEQYISDVMVAIYEDGDYLITKFYNEKALNISDSINYTDRVSKIYDSNGQIYKSEFEYSYLNDFKFTDMKDNNQNLIEVENFEKKFNCENTTTFTISELKEMCDDLNSEKILTK